MHMMIRGNNYDTMIRTKYVHMVAMPVNPLECYFS